MINLKDLIGVIPDLISLFLPGFLFLSIYSWFVNKKNDISIIILWSLFISYITNILAGLTPIKNSSILSIISILIATGLSIAAIFICKSNIFAKFLKSVNNKTINDDIFNDIIDYKKRTIMCIYLKNSDKFYCGTYCVREEKGLESWIVLVDYNISNDDGVIFDSASVSHHYSMAVNERDIERIELVYEDDSETWKQMRGYKNTSQLEQDD